MGEISLQQAAKFCGGRVAPRFAHLTFSGANFDSRRIEKGELFVALAGVRNGHDFVPLAMEKGACAVLASQPLAEDIPAVYVPDTALALQTLARRWREALSGKLRCVGITGSVGKTTTKEMIAAVLMSTYLTAKTAENFNNDIGLPVTVLGIGRECEAAVLEMGMNHFGEISRLTAIAQPDLAVITNIGTMHIENLGSREGILQAKLEILEGLRPGGIPVFCGDDNLLAPLAQKYGAVTFGLDETNDVRGMNLKQTPEGTEFTVRANGHAADFPVKLPVTGEHNVRNALAAVAVGLLWGVSVSNIQKALADFHNTGMRQRIYEKNGIRLIEDCYNAGPESMEAALGVLRSAKGRKFAALGGMLELGELAPKAHFAVGQRAAESCQGLFAYGANSEEYVKGAKSAGLTQAWSFASHAELANALRRTLQPGDTLLLKGSRGMKMERVLPLLWNEGGTKL